MSDKSKKATVKRNNNFIDLLYMTPHEISVKDIYNTLKSLPGITTELWEEMNVLELLLANQNSVDFEPLGLSFKNPSDAAFVKNRNIKTIFAITLNETDLDTVKSLFEIIINKNSGFLCADTEDFMPVYVGSSKKD